MFHTPFYEAIVCLTNLLQNFWLTPVRFSEHAVIIAGCHKGKKKIKKKGKEAATSVLKRMTHVTRWGPFRQCGREEDDKSRLGEWQSADCVDESFATFHHSISDPPPHPPAYTLRVPGPRWPWLGVSGS